MWFQRSCQYGFQFCHISKWHKIISNHLLSMSKLSENVEYNLAWNISTLSMLVIVHKTNSFCLMLKVSHSLVFSLISRLLPSNLKFRNSSFRNFIVLSFSIIWLPLYIGFSMKVSCYSTSAFPDIVSQFPGYA